jgi:hypothetical protein
MMLMNLAKKTFKQIKRFPMETAIRGLAEWVPMKDPEEGYTVVIACMNSLAPLAVANILLLDRQDRDNLREVVLVFDCPIGEIAPVVRRAVEEHAARFKITLVGYDERQYRVTRAINWGWVYSWLSWSLAIGRASTRAVIIHDLDAMPVAADFFERLYASWLETRPSFCGSHRYAKNGVTPEMGLVTTFELVLDAAYLRRRFKPFDLFNKLRLVDGRLVDFDTMLWVQHQSPDRVLRAVEETDLVHPTQLICNYTDLIAGRTNFQGRSHLLPILAYLLSIGNDPTALNELEAQLHPGVRRVTLWGKELYLDGLSPACWAWMEKQIRRLEQGLFGHTRPEIAAILQPFIRFAGDRRTVGKEEGLLGVSDR